MATTTDAVIELNVGGIAFSTTESTLVSPRAQNSFLSTLATTKLPTQRDSLGRIFIDRDGERFRIVLNFIRDGTVHVVNGEVPCAGGGSLALSEVWEEARFYGLEELMKMVESEMKRIELEEWLGGVRKREGVGSPKQVEEFGRGGGYQFRLDVDF